MALRAECERHKLDEAKKANAQHAANALAAQLPRLKLYTAMRVSIWYKFELHALGQTKGSVSEEGILAMALRLQNDHEANMEKVSNAVAVALQQMPLVNGATSGGSAEVLHRLTLPLARLSAILPSHAFRFHGSGACIQAKWRSYLAQGPLLTSVVNLAKSEAAVAKRL